MTKEQFRNWHIFAFDQNAAEIDAHIDQNYDHYWRLLDRLELDHKSPDVMTKDIADLAYLGFQYLQVQALNNLASSR